MAYLFKKNFFSNGQTNGRTDKRTHGQMDKRTDGRSDYIMPQILFGGIIKNIFLLAVWIFHIMFIKYRKFVSDWMCQKPGNVSAKSFKINIIN